MPSAICFIEKSRSQRKSKTKPGEWESGNWNVTEAKAQALVGKRIYFFETQSGLSYFGGTITGYQILDARTSEWPGRMVFEFLQDAQGSGFSAGASNWQQEQKTLP